jgi:hypothetical protein
LSPIFKGEFLKEKKFIKGTFFRFSCHAYDKVLPSHWQDFATALAKLCHRHGKSLPRRKQGVGKITS